MNISTSAKGRAPYYNENEKCWKVPLTKGKEASIDFSDVYFIGKWVWFVFESAHTSYAVRNARKCEGRRGLIYMHRELLTAKADEEVDHSNHFGLDNRRINIRRANRLDNARNRKADSIGTSKFKGVSWDKSRNKWAAQISILGKAFHLGRFNSEIEAAKTYNTKAKELFGEFAYLNSWRLLNAP